MRIAEWYCYVYVIHQTSTVHTIILVVVVAFVDAVVDVGVFRYDAVM